MKKRILKTLTMLGLSVCILVGGAVSGFAADAKEDKCPKSEDGKHTWEHVVEYKQDCVFTDFRVGNETVTLCPHCGREGEKNSVQSLTKVKNTFSNFSNLEIYTGTLKNGQKAMTVAFYYPTAIEKRVCTQCNKEEVLSTTKARVMAADVTANIQLPADAVKGYTLMKVNADGSQSPVEVSFDESGHAFFQLNASSGSQLIILS